MACRAINSNLTRCRNYHTMDSDFCRSHQGLFDHLHKRRMFRNYILGHGTHPYYMGNKSRLQLILHVLYTRQLVLTKEDILNIPLKNKYLDIFVLLCQHDYAKPEDHPILMLRCFVYYWCYPLNSEHRLTGNKDLLNAIEEHIICKSGRSFFDFLCMLPKIEKTARRFWFDHGNLLIKMTEFVNQKLEFSEAARELSWWSRSTRQTLLDAYRTVHQLAENHPFVRCAVQRWLPDLDELHNTEKQIQFIKMDTVKEELMMNRWHPDRVSKLYEMGIDPDDM